MQKITILFDGEYDDTDIIVVPDKIASDIEQISQEFLHWNPPIDDDDYWAVVDGKKYQAAETDGFIKWLNSFYCQTTEKAYVHKKHVNICWDYEIIEF